MKILKSQPIEQSSTIDKKAMDKDQDMFDPDEEDDKEKRLSKVYSEDFLILFKRALCQLQSKF